MKFQNDAKQLATKLMQERKKAVMVLIMRHLVDCNYVEAYKKLETEAGLSLDQVSNQLPCVCRHSCKTRSFVLHTTKLVTLSCTD